MTPSRRDFLKGCGALIVSFSAASSAHAQGQFDTHPGHIDIKEDGVELDCSD